MSSIVYQVDKKTGTKYAYESVSYWDKEKRQPRSKRKYIGKVDPVTGEIIIKGERKKHSDDNNEKSLELSRLYEEIKLKDQSIERLSKELKEAQKENDKLRNLLRKIKNMTEVDISNV